MHVLRRTDYPERKFTNMFIAYGPEDAFPAIELTHNRDRDEPYQHGDGYGHFAIDVEDVYGLCEHLRAAVKIVRPAGPMKHGTRVLGVRRGSRRLQSGDRTALPRMIHDDIAAAADRISAGPVWC